MYKGLVCRMMYLEIILHEKILPDSIVISLLMVVVSHPSVSDVHLQILELIIIFDNACKHTDIHSLKLI